MPAERGAEGARRAVTDAFGDSASPTSCRRSRSLATAMRQASRYSIGGRPTVRVKRSKNAERDSAAVLASWATVHERASWPCICLSRARRASANPRSSPVARPRRASPQRFDEQHLHQAREHEMAAGPPFARFLADQAHQHREPLDAAHVHERRQQRHQQRRVRRIEDEPAAEQPHVRAPTARAVADFTRLC